MTKRKSIFKHVYLFIIQFLFSIVASTIPVPSGIFIPVFKIGAALGRIVGESMHLWFPNGVRYGGRLSPILPGKFKQIEIVLLPFQFVMKT